MMSAFINGWTKEKVMEHIRNNFKGKSIAEDGIMCLYRGLNSKKCAVGMFIPDEVYINEMDDCGVCSLLFNRFPFLNQIMPLNVTYMYELQKRHDNAESNNQCLHNMLNYVDSLE